MDANPVDGDGWWSLYGDPVWNWLEQDTNPDLQAEAERFVHSRCDDPGPVAVPSSRRHGIRCLTLILQ
jgi:hypothetical protein